SSFCSDCYDDHRDLHAFPTRRSSDLATLSSGLAEWVRQESCRSSGITRLVLGGGCFHNKLLIQGVMDSLSDNSICLYKPQKISPDDSAIALGQAWIALQVYKNDD